MKNNDEFNSVKITNEGEKFSPIEFGSTQNSEFTFFSENKRNAGRDELNATTNKNNENVKLGKKQTNNNDLIDKAIQNATSSSAAASSASSSASAAATSSSVASTVVGATVVAIATIGTTIGITAISNNNASVKFEYFNIGETYVDYFLILEDTNDAPFKIWVENPVFKASKELMEGGNEGFFEGLSFNTSYRIYVKEDTDSGKIIFDSNFTTRESQMHQPWFSDIYFSQDGNYLDYTFGVTLSFFDPSDYYDNFVLTMYDTRRADVKSKSFELEKTTDEQILSGLNETGEVVLDIRNASFTYVLTYTAGGEEVELSSDEPISFGDSSNAKSEVYSVSVSDYADIEMGTIEVTIDYDDDFGILDNFVLHLVDVEEVTADISLAKTSDTQTINVYVGDDAYVSLMDEVSITFTYTKEGIEQEPIDLGSKAFIDTTPVINGVTVNELADFVNNTFTVQLDYVDALDKIKDLTLVMSGNDYIDGDFSYEIPLEKTLETQTIDFDDYDSEHSKRFRNLGFFFVLNWKLDGEPEVYDYTVNVDELHFQDSEGRSTEVRDITINPVADFITYEFTVQIDMDNPFDIVDRVQLYLSNGQSTHTFELEATTEEQTLCGKIDDEVVLNIRDGTFDYMFSYYVDDNLGQTNGQVTFENGNTSYEPSITGVSINPYANFYNDSFDVTLTIDDELNEISDITLHMTSLTNTQDGAQEFDINLEKTNATQEILASEYSLNLANPDGYSFVVNYSNKGQLIEGLSGSVTFQTDEQFIALETDFTYYESDGSYYMPLRLNYRDTSQVYREFALYIGGETVRLSTTHDWQNIEITALESLFGVETSFDLRATPFNYTTSSFDEEVSIYSTVGTIVEATAPKIYGLGLEGYTEQSYGSGGLETSLIKFDPDGGSFSNYQLKIVTYTNNEYTFELDFADDDFTSVYFADQMSEDDYQTLERELDNGVCSVYLIYTTTSSGSTNEILCADYIQFRFYA